MLECNKRLLNSSVFFIFPLHSLEDAAWCVCRTDVSNQALQKTLDYACGDGADCSPILQSGACYNPNTVLAHCSYAANSYYQRKAQAQGACDFSGSAMVTQNDPSNSGCSYPATLSAAGTSGTGIGTAAPNSSSSSSSTPTAGGSLTPTGTGAGTGIVGGLGPSGNTASIDGSGGGLKRSPPAISPILTILFTVWLRL
ncbi:Glucan endo-1,3-beta-glucosidase-like protein 3 [Apostasia shenzhenica]|uniref:Glucan endo-1,3-beta-glucosidase-like protein 3 n=1 Tax=Apostasia shenzhenica TaxID=1088818 RepID=A0A2I0A2I6_9ASPA|nr:Glucan endo-1,3-beta-glucosidase-like protein 3 [Apostasia shenzhenica]